MQVIGGGLAGESHITGANCGGAIGEATWLDEGCLQAIENRCVACRERVVLRGLVLCGSKMGILVSVWGECRGVWLLEDGRARLEWFARATGSGGEWAE